MMKAVTIMVRSLLAIQQGTIFMKASSMTRQSISTKMAINFWQVLSWLRPVRSNAPGQWKLHGKNIPDSSLLGGYNAQFIKE
jgi:hypothetical protein